MPILTYSEVGVWCVDVHMNIDSTYPSARLDRRQRVPIMQSAIRKQVNKEDPNIHGYILDGAGAKKAELTRPPPLQQHSKPPDAVRTLGGTAHRIRAQREERCH
jgi:hypothetical protein